MVKIKLEGMDVFSPAQRTLLNISNHSSLRTITLRQTEYERLGSYYYALGKEYL